MSYKGDGSGHGGEDDVADPPIVTNEEKEREGSSEKLTILWVRVHHHSQHKTTIGSLI